jgi:hypothetical protein
MTIARDKSLINSLDEPKAMNAITTIAMVSGKREENENEGEVK